MEYKEEDYLMISGLQHYIFCRRQWALIHIEQQWQENLRTVEGLLMHEKVHEENSRTKRNGIITIRGLKVFSHMLGVSGNCDAVEFNPVTEGIVLQDEPGYWLPYPVEYKRGSKKIIPADEAQLCAQAMCLEEMLCCRIDEGALYYGTERRRKQVLFTKELRTLVTTSFREMHTLYKKGYTPQAKRTKHCNACSMVDICIPEILKKSDVKKYLLNNIGDD